MTGDHDRFADWDGAYVLGALSSVERAEYEAHLESCDRCRTAVAEIAPTAGLLARLTAERARAIESNTPPTPDAALRGRVVSTARRRRLRARAMWAGAVAAAALVIAVPSVVAVNLPEATGTVYALDDVAGAPLEASVKLTSAEWGTRIDLVCEYTGEVLDAPPGGWPYALAVTADDGAITVLSTWRAGPGSTTELSAGTDLAPGRIESVEIRTIDGDSVVMRTELAGS